MKTHFTTTRKAQRLTAKYLTKILGIKATCSRNKTALGWIVNVYAVNVSKPVKSVCKSLSGRAIPVLTLVSKG